MLQFLPHMIATSAVYITRLLAQQTREREEVSKKTAGAGAGATPAATTAFAGSAAPAAPSAKGRRKRTLSDASVSTPATSAKKGRSEGAKKGPLSARKGSCSTTASAPASAPAPAASSSSSKGKKKQIPEIEPEKVWTAALQNFSGTVVYLIFFL